MNWKAKETKGGWTYLSPTKKTQTPEHPELTHLGVSCVPQKFGLLLGSTAEGGLALAET